MIRNHFDSPCVMCGKLAVYLVAIDKSNIIGKEKTVIDEILEAKHNFIAEKNKKPTVVHLTSGQVHNLRKEAESFGAIIISDIRGDLSTQRIDGMEIIEDGTGDIIVSD